MSSSMFIESSSSLGADSNSNLVVVYGKNGIINLDDKGLENLIDEKKISSISVVRITSPTPSMEEEEEEAKLEELVKRQDVDSANESSGRDEVCSLSGHDRSTSAEDDCSDNTENDDTTDKQCSNDKNLDENKSQCKVVPRRRGRIPIMAKNKKKLRKRRRERPKLVGLSFEEFYPQEDANEIVKKALKMAGLGPDRKSKEDIEFQLFVIKNDHCYTPFTSPSQMKAKLAADKLELERQASTRKMAPTQNLTTTGKQVFVRKKILQKSDNFQKTSKILSSAKDKIIVQDSVKAYNDENENDSDDNDADKTGSSQENEGSDYTEQIDSDDSDNDRDSDLDFDVNNPKGRRKKLRAAKINKKFTGFQKIMQKPRRVHTQEETMELTVRPSSNVVAISRQKQSGLKSSNDVGRVTIRSTPTKIQMAGSSTVSGANANAPTAVASTSPIIKKPIEIKLLTPTVSNVKTISSKISSANPPISPQATKEIIVHRHITSGQKTKGFTDINTLLMDQEERKHPVAIVNKVTPSKQVFTSHSPKSITSLKGFTPLGVETAAKNQLPAQISIQTHQSSSELEAEHDKQLDLIDSIVQDEMQKSNEILMPSNIIENIPELVKMLESTEAALKPSMPLNSNEDKTCENKEKSSVDRITHMTNTNLLSTPEGDDVLPDDILQQVVDLIKDDKTLQEAVDVLGSGDSNDPITNTNSLISQNPPPLAPISQPNKNILEDIPHSSKSIIQMSISNVTPNRVVQRPPIISSRTIQTPAKTSAVLRKEPIQIVRGNGRVITLPPIEAPTTRGAKRRAQIQPDVIQSMVQSPQSSNVLSGTASEVSVDSSSYSSPYMESAPPTIIQDKKNSDNRRRSKENITTAGPSPNQKMKRRTASKKSNKHQADIGASDSEGEDDDDPNKLWCICRQPHNNRFMICCDACEDWFHGTCVNITKAMGLEMEQKGIDWTCPKCVKKIEEQKQPKITEMLVRKPVPSIAQMNEPVPRCDSSVSNSVISKQLVTGNLEHSVANVQSNDLTQAQETPKSKIQGGQFININSFGGKKLIIQAANSGSDNTGQKKVFVATTQPLRTPPNMSASPIRTITVVKQISSGKQSTQQQNTQFFKNISASQTVKVTPMSTISTKEPLTPCIVCKKISRPNSIFCSDDCIRKHAQTAWTDFISKSQSEVSGTSSPASKNPSDDKIKRKSKGLFEEELSMVDRKTKMERVTVYERKSGRTLSGNNAPTFANLKKWLQDNPTFEVVRPGGATAPDKEKKTNIRVQHSSSPTIAKTVTSPPPLKLLPLSSSVQQKNEIRSQSPKRSSTIQSQSTKSTISDFFKYSPVSGNSRPNTPKQLQKYPPQVSIKSDKIQKSTEDVKPIKEKSTSVKRPASTEIGNKTGGNDGDIRHVVRRTLKEQLLQRIQEESSTPVQTSTTESVSPNDIPKMTPEEIEDFTKATELEMYNYFNRDTGTKYKAKYRSLLFNIKDRKNYTLYAKICAKLIEPKQLVRMSPEEMASQELAQWREQENKHQLEMIKKSELDMLSCAKNYVLKTHKGEEVIEGKSSEYGNVDINIIPVEDAEPATKKVNYSEMQTTSHYSDVEIHSHTSESITHNEKVLVEDNMKSSNHSKEREKEREKEKYREKDKDREKRHKSKDRHREKSRSRKRSRSPSRSRSRERSDKRHKSCNKDEKRGREKDRGKDRSERDQQSETHDKKTQNEKKGFAPKPRESRAIKRQTNEQHSNSFDTYNLVDKILESTKTVEEAANLSLNKEVENRKSSAPTPSITSTTCSGLDASYVVDIPAPANYVDSDQEPTSTVSIPTPPHDPYARFLALDSPLFESNENSYNSAALWKGNINMVDVTSFNLCIQPVVGNCSNLSKLLANELDVVGRIGPETVWDYISKIKKSPNKEIVIIRLLPSSDSETSAYKLLYEYLDNRSRLGVIKSISPFIKDFYIYPLGAGKLMPTVLRPNESVEFYDDPYRPDVLIGIIVRVVKRYNPIIQQAVTCTVDSTTKIVRTNNGDPNSPPGSPKSKKRRQSTVPKDIDVDAIIKAPIVSKAHKVASSLATKLEDADEPYSPGGSSDEDLPLLPIKSTVSSNQMQNAEEELKRKMEEINRQIAAQEMEIAGLLTGESTKFGKATGSTSKVLANIAIPSNLSQILASIKPTTGAQESQPILPPPPPLIGSLMKTPTVLNAVNDEYNPADPIEPSYGQKNAPSTSRLATLSEAELLSMVPDDIVLSSKSPIVRYEEPPPPGV
ncbi:protein partner of snf [Haematobia irritans]|uniref:protein partner of snf n=1 Tax=Haematobia irritans TaxID=7368 RepID=UPI003F4F5367